MKRIMGIAAMIATLGTLTARPAFAEGNTCVQGAKTDYKACKTQCQDDFQSAKFTCRGVEPACGKACLAGRQVCNDALEDILKTGQIPGGGTLTSCTTGTDACKAALQAAKQACGTPCDQNVDPVACDVCVDAAQVTAFVCRDTCRESWRHDVTVTTLRGQCKSSFQACVAACPKIGS